MFLLYLLTTETLPPSRDDGLSRSLTILLIFFTSVLFVVVALCVVRKRRRNTERPGNQRSM